MNSKKFLVIDIETLNHTEDALSYDVGYQIVDKHENVYVQRSFVIYDMFFTESDLMQSAYYACKIPVFFRISLFFYNIFDTAYPAIFYLHVPLYPTPFHSTNIQTLPPIY